MTIQEALQALNILDESDSKSKIKNNLYGMLTHMLKSKYQPEYENKSSWRGSIWSNYTNIANEIPVMGKGALYKNFYMRQLNLQDIYENAVIRASEETGKPIDVFPKECEWTKEQLSDKKFIYNFMNEYCPKNK